MIVKNEETSDLIDRIDEFYTLFGTAEEVYKSVQSITSTIDFKIHNEFRYCARALRELVGELINGECSQATALNKLQRAEHAAKNALNDSIDLVVGHAVMSLEQMAGIDSGKQLIIFIPDLRIIFDAIKAISKKIQESRNNHETRISTYVEISTSADFNKIIDFCSNIPIIENNIRTEHGNLVRQSRKFFLTSLFTILGIIMALPKFLSWLSIFIPVLKPWFGTPF